jgi:transcriptional regulator GlxA family with amidase domain
VGRDEAELVREHLLQLAARLGDWSRQRRGLGAGRQRGLIAPGKDRLLARRTLIHRYIESNQSRPVRLRDLAALLEVGEDRATHLVRECCGETFRDILVEARLRTARELLRFSSLPVLEAALCCGFNEISHFNRIFRRRVGCTPGQYRRKFSTAAGARSSTRPRGKG